MIDHPKAIARDLIARTEQAVTDVARLALESGITFEVTDIVDAVERGLPSGYPAPTTGGVTRRDFIEDIAQRLLSGELHDR